MRIFGSERMDGMLQQARPQGGRGDHPSLDQQGAREGAAEGRGAQLRHPQEPPQVRRRDERPAQGRLRAAPRVHGARRASRDTIDDMRARRGRRHRRAAHSRRTPIPSSGTSAGLDEDVQRLLDLDLPVADWAKEEGIADEEIRERLTDGGRRRLRRAHREEHAGGDALRSRSRFCCRCSTTCGASISSPSTTCARSSAGAATAQRDPLNEYKPEAFELFDGLHHASARAGDGASSCASRSCSQPPEPPAAADAGAPHRRHDRPRRVRRPRRAATRAADGARLLRRPMARRRGRRARSRRSRRPGAASAATSPAPAARARSSSTATASSPELGRRPRTRPSMLDP